MDWRCGLVVAAALLAGRAAAGLPAKTPAAHAAAHGGRRITPHPATWFQTPEIFELLWAMANGSDMGPGEGWFHPGQSRYGWDWLRRFDADHDGKVTRKEWPGPADWFDRLDRNHDGVLTAADFDWSDKATASRVPYRPLFFALDANGNGRISRQEWEEFFGKASKGKGYLTPEDLQHALEAALPKPPPPGQDDGPSPLTFIKGLLTGELGSFHEGPDVGEAAPDFALKTHDGKRKIRLSQYRGKKPVVMIFGSFT
jgi:Ca2+-binding EF-hand superfamily protein